MKPAHIPLILLVTLLILPACRTGEPATINALSEQERQEGWELIFDGSSLEGWRGLNMEEVPESHWRVEDGLLVKVDRDDIPVGPDGERQPGIDLLFDRPLKNFELYFEWSVDPVANSGIKYNVTEWLSAEHGNPHSALGFEYQIIDDPEYPQISENPSWATSGLYELVNPSPDRHLNPPGEWNTGRIVLDGNRGEHWLNGQRVLSFDLGSAEMRSALQGSKWADIEDFGRRHREAYITLQDHGDRVQFRNIKLRELPGSGETVSVSAGSLPEISRAANGSETETAGPAIAGLLAAGSAEHERVDHSNSASNSNSDEQEEFVPIFNGRDLTGWVGDERFWSVENGMIVGETTTDQPAESNTFLIWEEQKPSDFELRFDYRFVIVDEQSYGNSGMQIRSERITGGGGHPYRVRGYQADFAISDWIPGILYEEQGRAILARRGQRVQIDSEGAVHTESFATEEELGEVITHTEWNSYHVEASGDTIRSSINDYLMHELIDHSPEASSEGVLAFQLHAGPPMRVEIRNVMLKLK